MGANPGRAKKLGFIRLRAHGKYKFLYTLVTHCVGANPGRAKNLGFIRLKAYGKYKFLYNQVIVDSVCESVSLRY